MLKKTIFLLFYIIFQSFCLNAQETGVEALEDKLKKTEEPREKMLIFFQIAEKYAATNPQKSSLNAHQAYSIALDLGDDNMAAKAAYRNAEGYSQQKKYSEAKYRYNRGKESALHGNDLTFAVKCLERMADMAKFEGKTHEVNSYHQQAEELRRKGQEVLVAGVSSITPSFVNKAPPVTELDMNNLREEYRKQAEQLERDRLRLNDEINLLRSEKASLNTTMNYLRQREQSLSEQTQQAQQIIAFKNLQLSSVTIEKEELSRLTDRKQKLVESMRSEYALDSVVYAQEKQDQKAKLERANYLRNILLVVLLSSAVIGFLLLRRYRANIKQKRDLEDKNGIIENERQRSDELLLNILPVAISEELKTQGKAKARRYETASVMFTDFKSFTKISEQLTPEQLVHELDSYFKAFDFIISQYGLEKIKTIGDAYMCASGLSDRASTPLNMVRAALEIQEYLSDIKQEKIRTGEPYFEARIGINTGQVVAGVVGVKKFAYDVFGDTVNIAARMQETCESGCVNISESTFKEIRYNFECRYRGKLHAKNKGEIEMYYVLKAI